MNNKRTRAIALVIVGAMALVALLLTATGAWAGPVEDVDQRPIPHRWILRLQQPRYWVPLQPAPPLAHLLTRRLAHSSIRPPSHTGTPR